MITSRHNARLKLLRRLRTSRRSRRVQEHSTLLLEGRHLVETALELEWPIETLLVDDQRTADFDDLVSRAQSLGVTASVVQAQLLGECADADAPQGLVALARFRESELPAPAQLASRCCLYLDGLQDPGNVGALIRSAAAAGCAAVFAARGTCGWWHPRALRASAGAALRMPLRWGLDADSLRPLAEQRWIGLEAHRGNELWTSQLPQAGVLAVGSEAHGLSSEVQDLLDLRLNIPLMAGVESLNATVAASVALFEWMRRRRLASSQE